MEQRNQMTIVERALAMMVRNGEAKQHTVSIEMDDGRVKDISFYKLIDNQSTKPRKIIPQEEIRTNYY